MARGLLCVTFAVGLLLGGCAAPADSDSTIEAPAPAEAGPQGEIVVWKSIVRQEVATADARVIWQMDGDIRSTNATQGIVFIFEWESATPAADELRIDVSPAGSPSAKPWGTITGTSPLRLVIDPPPRPAHAAVSFAPASGTEAVLHQELRVTAGAFEGLPVDPAWTPDRQ